MGEPQRIVLVNKRRPALEAARRLGLETILWSEEPPGRTTRTLVERYLPGPVSAGEAGRVAAEVAAAAPIAVLAAGEGSVRAAAALRRHLGLAGLSEESAIRCSDKLAMKRAVAAAGIPCARFADRSQAPDRAALVDRLGLPMVIKRRVGWGGRGAWVARRPEEVPETLAADLLAERFVHGVEMSLEAFVADGRRLFTNPTEYLEVGWANVVPRWMAAAELAAVEALADRAIAALGVSRGLVHLELFLTDDGPVFGELAARPPGGHILRLIELAYGFDAWRDWVRLELGERPRGAAAQRVAGVRLLYPGPCRVVRVAGVEAAREVRDVVEASVRVRPGQELPPRFGIGQEAGRLLAVAADRERVVAALEAARRAISIEVEPLAPAAEPASRSN